MADTTHKQKSERLRKLQQKRARLQRQIALEETRIKSQERKTDTRRKIIAGAIVLAHADIREAFRDILYELLQKFVEPKDKYLFPEVFTPEQIAQANIETQQARHHNLTARALQQSQDTTSTDQDTATTQTVQDTPPEAG